AFLGIMNSSLAQTEPDSPSQAKASSLGKVELRLGVLRLPALLMQGLGHTAPATAILITLPFIASHAGIVAPLAYLLAFLLVLMLGLGLTQLAKHLPSAGGYY